MPWRDDCVRSGGFHAPLSPICNPCAAGASAVGSTPAGSRCWINESKGRRSTDYFLDPEAGFGAKPGLEAEPRVPRARAFSRVTGAGKPAAAGRLGSAAPSSRPKWRAARP